MISHCPYDTVVFFTFQKLLHRAKILDSKIQSISAYKKNRWVMIEPEYHPSRISNIEWIASYLETRSSQGGFLASRFWDNKKAGKERNAMLLCR